MEKGSELYDEAKDKASSIWDRSYDKGTTQKSNES